MLLHLCYAAYRSSLERHNITVLITVIVARNAFEESGDGTFTSPKEEDEEEEEGARHAGECVGVAGLWPCGEGAGHAGGIVSAAVDGARIASALIDSL
jgi:hypothetical protein